jgi:four helix bundle protein
MCAKRVEDLEVWQLANEMRDKTYELINASKKPLDRRFRSEIEDALASATKNIGEGFGRWRHKEFAQFLRYSRGSVFEVAECIKDGVSRRYWTTSATPGALKLCDRTQKALAAFIKCLESNPDP